VPERLEQSSQSAVQQTEKHSDAGVAIRKGPVGSNCRDGPRTFNQRVLDVFDLYHSVFMLAEGALDHESDSRVSMKSKNSGQGLYGFSIVFITACTPFEVICTPMHNSTNATTRRIPCAVCGDTRSVIFGAYA
jgi:hypothetical protein